MIAVSNRTSVAINKEELYQAVEDICLLKGGPGVYEKLALLCQSLIEERINALSVQSGANYVNYLQSVDQIWLQHCEIMTSIRNIFLYLDRSYAIQSNNTSVRYVNNLIVLPICDMGNYYFKAYILKRRELLDGIITATITAIDIDRQVNHPKYNYNEYVSNNKTDNNNSDINPHKFSYHSTISSSNSNNSNGVMVEYSVLRNICYMLHALGLYESVFAPRLLEDASRYFTMESQQLYNIEEYISGSRGVSDPISSSASTSPGLSVEATKYFLYHVEYRVLQVNHMINRYLLYESTRHALIKLIESTLLISYHTSMLIESGFSGLLDTQSIGDITILFNLLSRLDNGSVTALSNHWGQYIKYVISVCVCC